MRPQSNSVRAKIVLFGENAKLMVIKLISSFYFVKTHSNCNRSKIVKLKSCFYFVGPQSKGNQCFFFTYIRKIFYVSGSEMRNFYVYFLRNFGRNLKKSSKWWFFVKDSQCKGSKTSKFSPAARNKDIYEIWRQFWKFFYVSEIAKKNTAHTRIAPWSRRFKNRKFRRQNHVFRAKTYVFYGI